MKRVLILTYYFPPAGGAPVQRVLKWTRYLPEFGWKPVILTVADGAFSSRDETLAVDLPENAEVIRTRSWDPFRLYAIATGKEAGDAPTIGFVSDKRPDWRERFARWVRSNIFIPDARVGWLPYARSAGHRILREGTFDAILSTGPPHSVHLAARSLKKRHDLPWVTDFRDPWTDSHYLSGMSESAWTRSANRFFEHSVMHRANLVTTVSPTLVELLRTKAGETPVELLHNGYDEADFANVECHPPDVFTLTYGGNMAPEQNPKVLWRAIANLRESGGLKSLRIRLVGSQDVSVRSSLSESGLLDVVEDLGQVSRGEAIGKMASSSVLLVVINKVDSPSAGGVITTKAYEYLRLGWPTLAVGPVGSDLDLLLRETGRGELFSFDNCSGMEAYLAAQYKKWEEGTLVAMPSDSRIEKYQRRESARQLAGMLSDLAS